MSKLFEERVHYKPFEYPVYYNEGWLKQAQAFWLHTEIAMQSDVKDWKENLTVSERNLVGNILLGFAQTECAVSDYWTGMVTKWFPKHEIKQMAMMLAKSPEARKNVARSLAIFSAFAEGVSLYSSFAVLYSFQMRNLLKGVGQQMKWSVRDESLHSRMGCKLFNHMCEEYPELKAESKDAINEAAKLIVDLEVKFIDKMFEMGDLENLKATDLKEFIKQRANEKLVELGYDPIFIVNQQKASNLEWFYHLTGGHTHTDFFAIRSTDYSKAGEGDDWEDIF